MSKRLDENLGSVGYDGLIVANEPVADVLTVTIRKEATAAATYKRGTVMALSAGTAGDGKLVILGSTATTNETLTANCILAEDVEVGTTADVTVLAYRTGHFARNKLAVASGYTLKATDEEELRKRGFGEALYSQLTPEQRQQTLILRDADELGELITNREEAMAAETMLTNGCVMKHIADDVDKADEMEIRFYSEASNPATYTPTAKWDATGGKILKDLEAMIRMLTKRGLRASDLVCSPDVADTIINDAAVQKLLDNRRIEIGNVEPELLPDGAAIVARLNVLGRIISVISYDLTYTDDEGNDKLYIPSGKCVLTAPGAGRTAYGAVSQVEQSDGEFHTYAGRRVPKYVSSAEGNSRTLTISSRPLMIPNNKNPFIVADVLTD